MTAKEFNEKYKAFLEEGNYGMALKEELIPYVDNIFQNLIKIPGFKYTQIKHKYNFICFYTNLNPYLNSAIEMFLKRINDKPDDSIK